MHRVQQGPRATRPFYPDSRRIKSRTGATRCTSDIDPGIKCHFPNLTQIQVNAVIGFAVAELWEYDAGKLSS
jgi:hypothetical protein